jgi:hypothetical protein
MDPKDPCCHTLGVARATIYPGIALSASKDHSENVKNG